MTNPTPATVRIRKWILWLLFIGFAWLVLVNLDEMKKLAVTFASAEACWILAAGGVMVVYYLVYTLSFQVSFHAVGIRRSLRELVPVVFGMLFVNLVTPSGGSAGVALFVDDAARRGHSGARAMSATILQLLADFGSLSLLLAAGLVYMASQGSLSPYHVAGAGIQFVLVILLAGSLMLGLWAPKLLTRLLEGIQHWANRAAAFLHQKSFLPEGWAERYAGELTEASGSIAEHPSRLLLAFLAMFLADLLAMTALFLLFPAYHTQVVPGTAMVGYVVGILFWMIPITPQGVVIVESAMTLTFISLRVPAETALAVTLAFRGLIFWLPAFLGFLLIGGVKTFCPALPAQVSEQERQRARRIVHAHGRTSVAHLALLDDKRYYFSPGGSLVPHAVCGRVAVTLGDPIGPVDDSGSAIRDFVQYCTRNGWKVVFSMVELDYLEFYRKAGFTSMCLGHEGVVDLKSFTLKGNAHKTLRKRYNRFHQAGFQIVVCEPPIRDDVLGQLRQISDEWLEMTGAREKRFFLARFEEDYIRRERLVVVYAPDGEISAFANLVPEYQRNGLSIDIMRHGRKFVSGTMDFLFVALLFWAREHGYSTFNLGLSPLFGVRSQPYRTFLDPILSIIYKSAGFYNFSGINGFKKKFRPVWTPQYMVFPGYPNLLETGLALAKANAGQGETLLSYFKSHPKRVLQGEPETESRQTNG